MSLHGPQVPNLKALYTEAEIEKFSKISDAIFAKNAVLAKQLLAQLKAPEETGRFKAYAGDLSKIQARQKELAAQLELQNKKIASLDAKIDALDQKEALIFSQGSRKAVDESKARALPSNPSQQPSTSAKYGY